MTARVVNNILGRLVTGNVPIPYDSIGMIDSRMWDPTWSGTYGKPYNSLVNVLSFGFGGDRQKAMTVASGESYRWGSRGGQPIGMLRQFDDMTPEQVFSRLADWIRRIRRGEGWSDVMNAVGNPVPVANEAGSGSAARPQAANPLAAAAGGVARTAPIRGRAPSSRGRSPFVARRH